MPITDILERNSRLYGEDVCLVELNPEQADKRRVTWKEYELMEPTSSTCYRREITWNVFNEKANRFAICCSAGASARATRWGSFS